ncbi:DUF4091 domain-containing protein, partial [Candidatus Woesearchaeota archaeon]|nr:DUF4091 domain-containing protein [Candidatus Woesearchaeota archaeon]
EVRHEWDTEEYHPPWNSQIDPIFSLPYHEYVDIEAYNPTLEQEGMENDAMDTVVDHLHSTQASGMMYLNRALKGSSLTSYDLRFDHGLYLWYLPPEIIANVPWTYQFVVGDPFDDLESNNDGFGDWLYVYPDPLNNNEPLPSYNLMGVREGIDDIKYLYTLEKAIETSANSTKKQEAQELLDDIRQKSTIVMDCEAPEYQPTGKCPDYVDLMQQHITPEQIDVWRKEIVDLILDLKS